MVNNQEKLSSLKSQDPLTFEEDAFQETLLITGSKKKLHENNWRDLEGSLGEVPPLPPDGFEEEDLKKRCCSLI